MGIEILAMDQGCGSASGSLSSGSCPPHHPQLNSLPLDGSVVKLRGLPFRASLEDVLKFFTGFPELISGNIYFKRHPDGRPSGEVGWGLCGT
jgi:hypothetical protein